MVSLKDCKNLKALPSRLEMDSLRKLILSGCSKFRKLPEFGENMEYLSIIELKDCKNLACLPDSISNLKSLKSLNIDGCAKFQSLPNNLDENEGIEELDVSGTAITSIPSCIVGLKHLSKLYVDGCNGSSSNSSRNLLSLISRTLGFTGSEAPIRLTIPPSIFSLSSLRKLRLRNCNLKAGSIPDDLGCFSSLQELDLSGNNFGYLPAGSLVFPPSLFSSLSSLKELNLQDCNLSDGSIPDDLSSLSSLFRLNLSRNNFTKLPYGLVSNLLSLHSLDLNHCKRLLSFPDVPPNVSFINAICCHPSMEHFSEVLWKFLSSSYLRYIPRELLVPGNEIPSWFHNQNFDFLHEFKYCGWGIRRSRMLEDEVDKTNNLVDCIISIKIDISRFRCSNKKWGVSLCLVVQGTMPSNCRNPYNSVYISIFVTPESNDSWFETRWKLDLEGNQPHLFIFFLTPSGLQYGRGELHTDELRLTLMTRRTTIWSVNGHEAKKDDSKSGRRGSFSIKKCGWRLASQEELGEYVEEWQRKMSECSSTSHQELGEDDAV
ncbi:disease resistance protein RPV1-like [Prosopis cineraria]|uniref:disease resistance protein RPV1-like n=1 Tax=Prosopis cineraria TaxID=364024 RepID=UPI00240EE5A6|nr:disease resistance protein RPV1-like [Prosopis cineraria]